jgi:LysM repeat protein
VETETYVVRRGDSLWKIAKERLGDGARYVELVDLNADVLDGHPDFLTPGTVLRVPAASAVGGQYVVRPGDTLSEIAGTELGDAAAYPEIFDASSGTVQPDGDRLTDPDLIRPGWRLTIPSTDQPPRGAHPEQRTEPPGPEPSVSVPPEIASEAPPVTASDDDKAGAPAEGDDSLPSWVLPGLAGGGAALAGSLLLVLRQHRRTQLRYRRPGHVIVPPPDDLRPAEKSAHAAGSITALRIEDLDRALRLLGEPSTPCPRLVSVALSADAAVLRLAEPTDLLAPWSGEGTTWRARLGDIPAGPGTVAPYPLLVSVGMDAAGSLIFVNLEEVHPAVLTGPIDQATALARHIAAELSLNPWSTLVDIDTLGIGDELVDIDPVRLRQHPEGHTAFLDRLVIDLDTENPALEPDQYRALITTTDDEAVRKVAKIVTSYEGRAGAAVLTIGQDPTPDEVELRLDSTRHLAVDALDLNLTATGLSADEARACATLVSITRDASVMPVPTDDDATHPADEAGALKSDLTDPRPTSAPAGSGSLLPLDATEYEERAAIVAEDVERLAPVAGPQAATRVTMADADLDEDVARWHAATLAQPKLTLLGPVTARGSGDAVKIARRRPYYYELLAFLTLHPKGVTIHEIGEAMGVRPERARNDISAVRGWLGTNTKGEPYLPNARQTHEGGVAATYAVRGILTDLDLFRRLRARGQSRGAAGIDDLRAALSLVAGEPFSDLRPHGWSWLLDGDRIDHISSCAIVDTAHIVTTHGLATGDLQLAAFAANTGCTAAPYDETARLDAIAVRKALGDDQAADRALIEGIIDRSDDELGPIELPEQTAKIISQRGWDQPRTRTAG